MIRNENLNLPIEVDGRTGCETLKLARDVGAKVFAAGSYIFKNGNIRDQVTKLKEEDE